MEMVLFQILERINDNAYHLDLLGEYKVSSTFNVADLRPFLADDDIDLRTNPSDEEGNHDGSQVVQGTSVTTSNDPIKVLVGPVARSCAKKFKDSLMALVRWVQDQEGTYKVIKGAMLEGAMKTLIYVEDIHEG